MLSPKNWWYNNDHDWFVKGYHHGQTHMESTPGLVFQAHHASSTVFRARDGAVDMWVSEVMHPDEWKKSQNVGVSQVIAL